MNTITRRISDGIEEKQFFDTDEQQQLLVQIEQWFEDVRSKIPKEGIFIYAPKNSSNPFKTSQGIKLPKPVIKILDAMLKDAKSSKKNSSKPIVKVLVERTGSKWTNIDDRDYHVDSNKLIFDKNWNRIGYEKKRGQDKYMAFIGRPGSYVIEGKIDPSLTYLQATKISNKYSIDQDTGETHAKKGTKKPKVIKLNSDKIYKVAVGDLLHGPPPHQDGLLITLSLVDEIPKAG